jgi:hypothetical protein
MDAIPCGSVRPVAIWPRGCEQSQDSGGKPYLTQPGGANSGALAQDSLDLGSELACLVMAWATLPPAMRAGILAMVQAASHGGGDFQPD